MTTQSPNPRLKLVLGSGSPRRLELLSQIGLQPHDIRAPDIDETVHKGELPRTYVNRVAAEKAAAVPLADDEIGLCADTTVAVGRLILGKPKDASEATAFLKVLSGRRHQVITAVAVKQGTRIWQKDVVTQVKMKPLSADEIDWYVATGDWTGKAGAYGIQGPASVFIPWISGSFHAVMGLPLPETAGLLTAAGLPVFKRTS